MDGNSEADGMSCHARLSRQAALQGSHRLLSTDGWMKHETLRDQCHALCLAQMKT